MQLVHLAGSRLMVPRRGAKSFTRTTTSIRPCIPFRRVTGYGLRSAALGRARFHPRLVKSRPPVLSTRGQGSRAAQRMHGWRGSSARTRARQHLPDQRTRVRVVGEGHADQVRGLTLMPISTRIEVRQGLNLVAGLQLRRHEVALACVDREDVRGDGCRTITQVGRGQEIEVHSTGITELCERLAPLTNQHMTDGRFSHADRRPRHGRRPLGRPEPRSDRPAGVGNRARIRPPAPIRQYPAAPSRSPNTARRKSCTPRTPRPAVAAASPQPPAPPNRRSTSSQSRLPPPHEGRRHHQLGAPPATAEPRPTTRPHSTPR